jgi:hypothetical protein
VLYLVFRPRADACVVDEQRDADVAAKALLDDGALRGVGEIGGQDIDLAARIGPQACGQCFESSAVSGDEHPPGGRPHLHHRRTAVDLGRHDGRLRPWRWPWWRPTWARTWPARRRASW